MFSYVEWTHYNHKTHMRHVLNSDYKKIYDVRYFMDEF